MRYYLGRYLYKKPGMDDYLSLDRIEDLFSGFKPMLAYLVEDLVFKGKLNDAMGVCTRHDLLSVIRDETRETLADTVYNPKLDAPFYDFFGPLSGETHFKLPVDVKVEWIGSEEDIDKLDYLLTQRYIGVDSEWRPALAKFHRTNPSLF